MDTVYIVLIQLATKDMNKIKYGMEHNVDVPVMLCLLDYCEASQHVDQETLWANSSEEYHMCCTMSVQLIQIKDLIFCSN